MTATLFPTGPPSPRRLTLIRLSSEIARAAAAVGPVAVEGEVHKPSRGAGGRIWFTLRDRAAQVRVTCPAARARWCRAVHGERALVVGALRWVNERGELQLEASEVTPVGEGAVRALLAETRARLVADGLVDRPRRPLPVLPAVIGVVCGTEAAVRADIESVVAVRFPGYPVVFAETTVSGPGAPEGILAALSWVVAVPGVEVVILARGGGDSASLLPWSDEAVCRAVAACPVPVVSAIGHEGDRPLCDEVADLRCGTPSLAAGAVVPSRELLAERLSLAHSSATAWLLASLAGADRRLAALDAAPAWGRASARAAAELRRGGDRLVLCSPARRVADGRRRLLAVDHRAPAVRRVGTARTALDRSRWADPLPDRCRRLAHQLDGAGRQMDALDPRRVLARGYAVVRAASGEVIRDAAVVAAGEEVGIELAAGVLAAVVTGTGAGD